MKGLEFPIIGTKVKGLNRKFDLSSPEERRKYFNAKVGSEIAEIRNFLKKKTFVAYWLGKKNSGKGTYSHLFAEIFGDQKVALVSVGDVVRETHANWKEFVKTKEYERLKSTYRGFISFEDAVDSLLGRTTNKLLPTEFILSLLKVKIEKLRGKTIFIDGLPRELDQVSYSLYFRDLMGYRDDRDVFVLIDIPESVIAERIKTRVVCPVCHDLRSTKLLMSRKVEYDEKEKKFYLVCDNPKCKGARMIQKEGDNLGIDPIRPRLEKDEEILRKAFLLHGVPKVFLRNHVPANEVEKYYDDYEITPEYVLTWDAKKKEVVIGEKPWVVKDDNGVDVHSLLSSPVVVSLIKQLAEVLAQ